MKFVLTSVFLLTSFASFAGPLTGKCISTVGTNPKRAAVLCAGVKTDKEIEALKKCFVDSPDNADRSAVLCSGVKNAKEMATVFKCFDLMKANGDRSAILCSGVKADAEIAGIQKCFDEVELDWDLAAIACSKASVGTHLFAEKFVQQPEVKATPVQPAKKPIIKK